MFFVGTVWWCTVRIYWQKDKKNMIGENIRRMRRAKGLTQKNLAAKVQTVGLDMDRLAIVRIEAGTRVVADYEVYAFALAFAVPLEKLYK